ncbi:diguanylate cyclase [Dongia rigui]|uniref:diguanylate cyclase n=1 Tax=Dongia rigui TaxID=940149 RepID=A0ABU5DZE6_9PROT|nr:diguanylate cyclase [Dongia rigui]MDY0872314.1 diguanylate cyclase [Dongia rigui]
MPLPLALHTAVYHSLDEQIAVIDAAGTILDYNLAWKKFGAENGMPDSYDCKGKNYLETLTCASDAGDSFSEDAMQCIADVLAGKSESFYCEYPCHSPHEKRWFTMRVSALHGVEHKALFVISHHNITQRKLAEELVEELAMRDPLTGLSNRRAYKLFLDREIRRNVRAQGAIGLVLVDVDNFKSFNDLYGHAAGDQLLNAVGQILLGHARRPGDLAVRLGGDEFALILDLGESGLKMVHVIGQSILTAARDLRICPEQATTVSVSIGFLSVVPQEHHTQESLFKEADKALYRAKSAGRDRAFYVDLNASSQADACQDRLRTSAK